MFEGVEPMGRGRAKAKQVKVARQLKYNSGGTDLDRLRAELGVGRTDQGAGEAADGDLMGRYSDYAGGAEPDEDDDEARRPLTVGPSAVPRPGRGVFRRVSQPG